ncbi:MAG: polyketide cyclase [Mesorhizobium sp.]|nr:MAG: polyketide cyclase [Mesorhizobium sp.]
MTIKLDIAPTNERELVLARIIDAPRENVYRCWTDPNLVTQWFAPKPWTTPRAEMDVRAGGSSLVVMAGPDGNEFPNPGVFLEVVPGRKIVFTDAYIEAWQPSEKPFMTVALTFEDDGNGKTRYIARVRHWSVTDREQHEKMGFHEGWGQCADQLEELAKTL